VKRCPDCGKPLSEFPRNRRTKSGYATYCKPCHNGRGNESRRHLHGSSRHYHLKRRYGIGASEVEKLIREQGNLGPICERSSPDHVDHDHATGQVRGVLCFNCNGGLGQFGDDAERLVRAQLYLDWSDMSLEEQTRASDLARQRVGALRGRAA
jgi:Recombination endonuclease VII